MRRGVPYAAAAVAIAATTLVSTTLGLGGSPAGTVLTPVGFNARADLIGCTSPQQTLAMRKGQALLLLNKGTVPVVITSDTGITLPPLAHNFWHEVVLTAAGTWHFTFKRPAACGAASTPLVVVVS